jgi:hypothetical protein
MALYLIAVLTMMSILFITAVASTLQFNALIIVFISTSTITFIQLLIIVLYSWKSNMALLSHFDVIAQVRLRLDQLRVMYEMKLGDHTKRNNIVCQRWEE